MNARRVVEREYERRKVDGRKWTGLHAGFVEGRARATEVTAGSTVPFRIAHEASRSSSLTGVGGATDGLPLPSLAEPSAGCGCSTLEHRVSRSSSDEMWRSRSVSLI